MARLGGLKPSYTPPELLDEYRIVRLLGSGAMGYVYLAEDTLLQRPVAVKFIAQRRPDATARRHFMAEARALARLQHPNVVAVHRVGEIDDHPYLVTELVRGKSLSELTLPLPGEQVITVGLDLARGLAAAHRKGVLHRDIKPANAVLAEDGDAKLIDFGLAVVADPEPQNAGEQKPRDASGAQLAGTPLYMAPEALRSEAATTRSDLYSLGAVLYELCAGVAHRDSLSPDVDEDTWISGVAEAVERRAPGLDLRLARIIARCLAFEPEERFSSADALADALAALRAGPVLPVAPAGNPYRGLIAFEAEHRALFFGRTSEARAVVDRLRFQAFTVVTGDSGAGKSSLCRAGVLPLVADGALADGRRYQALTVVPGKRPCSALVTALCGIFSLDEVKLAEAMRDDLDALPRALRRALGKEQGALVLVDQAEELVTLAEPAEARAFAELVVRLPSAPAGVRVLLTVRGDFFTRLAALPGLGEELARSLYLLRPLSPEGIRAAITGPAAQQGVTFEPASLVDTLAMAAEGTPGGLPLLQFALAELWEARKDATTITPALLAARGGVEGALTRHADEVVARLDAGGRVAAKRLLLTMVTVENTRIRRTTTELASSVPEDRAALEALVTGRLVVARETEGEIGYELAHEALIQRWDTLRGWLGDGGETRARQARLEAAATEWERLQRTPELLLGGKRLADAESLREGASGRARDLLEASQVRARKERWRRWGLAAAGPLVVGLALGGLRWKQGRDLERLIGTHLAAADSAREAARPKKQEAEAKRLSAYALFDAARGDSAEEVTKKRDEAEGVWAGALEASRAAEAELVRAGHSLESALALDPGRTAIRAAIGDVTGDRLTLAEEFHVEDRRGDLVLRLGDYDPGAARMTARLAAPHVSLVSTPAGARVTLERYEDRAGRKVPVVVGDLGETPLREVVIPGGPGSYRMILKAPGRVDVDYPVLLGAGERFEAQVPLPRSEDAPEGYAYVPAGRFLLGSAEPEPLRKGFILAPPLHEVKAGAVWMARNELTFGEWLTYLDAQPADERAKRLPSTQTGMWAVAVRAAEGSWQLAMTLNGNVMVARRGEAMHLPARPTRATLNWERLPVCGVSMDDIEAYFRWLDTTGKVRGARPCDEREWEWAFRGADGRVFPHGDVLGAEDADFDLTYGRKPLAFGPDEVGSHPASTSPFGLLDMTGNAYELTRSIGVSGEVVMRGGAWYYDSTSAIAPSRTVGERQTRDHLTGTRGCASIR
jgi:formylglycine-generating enzyme required for sulfatase activity/type II secretory pathway predicted ATPase ExeA